MTWQIYTLLAIIANALEEIIDKVIMISPKTNAKTNYINNPLIASFYRNLAFWIFTALAAVLGVLGDLHLFIPIPLIILGVLWPFSSLIYHHMLQTIELSKFSGISYIFPFLLIFVDKHLFGISFSNFQYLGFSLLIFGALLISFDFSPKTIKGLSLKIWALLFIKFLYGIAVFIIFKYYSHHPQMNEVTFYFWTWLVCNITFISIILAKGKASLCYQIAHQDKFLLKTFIGKFFDFLGGIFILKAIHNSSITQVKSLESLYPIILVTLIFTMNRMFKIKTDEDFSKRNTISKIIAVTTLSIGGYLIMK